MDLRDNAYDFVNESLRAAQHADHRARAWKFAIVHIVQAIELLLKERLRQEHAVLVWENVDRPKHTVSLAVAVARITGALGIQLSVRELHAIEKARRWRDLMIHYEFDVQVHEVKAIYARKDDCLFASQVRHRVLGSCETASLLGASPFGCRAFGSACCGRGRGRA
jgi:hypothetical protein